MVTLIDLLLRRTHIAFVGGVTAETLAEVAEAAAPVLGWDADTTRAQIDDAARVLQERHRIDVETSHLAPLSA